MKRKLYQEIASYILAKQNCINSKNEDWEIKHTEYLENYLLNKLSHGSGINGKWQYDYTKSNANKIILRNTYDAMNENGFYDKYINFTVTVSPSLAFEIDLSITGNFGKYQDIKEYLHEILYSDLVNEIDTDCTKYK
jgi:hypothetical protein